MPFWRHLSHLYNIMPRYSCPDNYFINLVISLNTISFYSEHLVYYKCGFSFWLSMSHLLFQVYNEGYINISILNPKPSVFPTSIISHNLYTCLLKTYPNSWDFLHHVLKFPHNYFRNKVFCTVLSIYPTHLVYPCIS